MNEQTIKTALDGKFYSLSESGRINCRAVPVDYIHDHRPHGGILIEEDAPHHNAVPFTPEQDDIIIEMRANAQRWASIARTIRRCIHRTRERYAVVCAERGIEQAARMPSRPSKFTEQTKAQIFHMREVLKMPYEAIAHQMGLTKWQVADAVNRVRKQKRRAAA